MLPALIGAAAGLAGGLLNKSSADSAREASIQHSLRQEALQKEFAQSGIQWRVEDAKKAGIHPIYALGGSGASYSPTSSNFTADTSMGSALAQAGQDISSSMQKTQTAGARVDAYTAAAQKLSLEKGSLENELLRTELASKTGRLRQTSNPPFPTVGNPYLIPGQADSGIDPIKNVPLERIPGRADAPHAEPGSVTDVGYARTAGGGYAAVPSKDVKERIEDNLVQELMWAFRNNVMPSFGLNQSPPPKSTLPKGYDAWVYSPFKQEYTPHKRVPYLPFNLYY